jgi:antitoxin VapB
MRLREQLGPVDKDFLSDREQGKEQRDPFEGWKE